MATHNRMSGLGIHEPWTWKVADSTARLALNLNDELASERIYFNDRLCLQLDDNSMWRLSDYSIMAWTMVGGVDISYTPENVSNKVTAFQLTPDDVHYPSEKLVKDELDGKQPSGTYSTDIHSNIADLDNVSGTNTGDQDLSGLVEKETGKGLSTNDFTDDLESKLNGIDTGAQVNVQSDWEATTGDAFIQNKPDLIDPTFQTVTYETQPENHMTVFPTPETVNLIPINTIADWVLGAGWTFAGYRTEAPVGTPIFNHTPGNVEPLVFNGFTPEIGKKYTCYVNSSNSNSGSYSWTFGGESHLVRDDVFEDMATAQKILIATTNGKLTITPSSDYTTNVTAITILEIEVLKPFQTIEDDSSNVISEYCVTKFNDVLLGKNAGHGSTNNGDGGGIFGSAEKNTAIGNESLYLNTSGFANVAIGYRAGYNQRGNYNAVMDDFGKWNTFVGTQAGYNALQKTDAVNSMALGYNSYTTKDNQVVIGNDSVAETVLKGQVKVLSTTESTSATSGGEVIDGGLGVAKNINAGGNIAGLNLSGTNTGDSVITNVIFVDKNGNDATGTGVISKPLLTIYRAIQILAGLSEAVQKVTAIKIGSGTFADESLFLLINTTLIGESDGTTVIIGGHTVGYDGYSCNVKCYNIRFENTNNPAFKLLGVSDDDVIAFNNCSVFTTWNNPALKNQSSIELTRGVLNWNGGELSNVVTFGNNDGLSSMNIFHALDGSSLVELNVSNATLASASTYSQTSAVGVFSNKNKNTSSSYKFDNCKINITAVSSMDIFVVYDLFNVYGGYYQYGTFVLNNSTINFDNADGAFLQKSKDNGSGGGWTKILFKNNRVFYNSIATVIIAYQDMNIDNALSFLMENCYLDLTTLPAPALYNTTNNIKYSLMLSDGKTYFSENVTLPSTQFDTTNDNPVHSEGLLFYDKTKKALSYYNEEEDVTVNIGQEVLIRVKNTTGVTIANGAIVYPLGFDGENVLIGLALASDKEKCRLIGVTTHDIPTGETGYVTKLGEVGSIDTSSFSSGDVVYLSPTIAGGITKTKPTGATYITRIGAVKIQDATTGSIVVDIATSEFTVEVSQDVGFSTSDTATMAFTNSTPDRTLTLSPVGTSFCFYQYGDKYCKTTDSIQIPDEEGLFVIYYNLGTLAYLKNPTNAQIEVAIKNYAIVAYVYWNATDNKSEYVGYELHGIGMSAVTHAYLHFAFGARYMSGLAPNTIVADGNGDLAVSAQFGVDSGAISDEDIYLPYAGIGSTVGLPIAYLSGTSAVPTLRTTANAGYSVLTAGTGRLAYNTLSGGNYVLSEVTNGDYALCHIIAINENNAGRRLVAFVGQTQYTTLSNARAGALIEIKALRVVGILPQEAKAIATFIFETDNSYDNAVKSRVRTIETGVNYVDWRTTYLNGSSSGSTGGTTSTIFSDELFQIIDDADATKVMRFQTSGITTGTTRTLTIPNASGTLSLVAPYSVFVDADKIIGGTALAYQSVVIGSKPYIVRKFNYVTTNTGYFSVDLPKVKSGTQIKYRFKFIVTETSLPALNSNTVFTLGNGATVTYTYAGTEAQNDILTTDWTALDDVVDVESLTVTGTYEQYVGVLPIEIEYSRE